MFSLVLICSLFTPSSREMCVADGDTWQNGCDATVTTRQMGMHEHVCHLQFCLASKI